MDMAVDFVRVRLSHVADGEPRDLPVATTSTCKWESKLKWPYDLMVVGGARAPGEVAVKAVNTARCWR